VCDVSVIHDHINPSVALQNINHHRIDSLSIRDIKCKVKRLGARFPARTDHLK
jgi:hypothetical protein